MSEHVIHLLSAYHDGELANGQARRVEAHLQSCVSCRERLTQMQALTYLLAEAPLHEVASTERFSANVGMLLPRRESPASQQLWRGLQKVVPFGLVGLWGFVQAVFTAAFFLQVLLQSGMIPQLTALVPAPEPSFFVLLLNMQTAPNLAELFILLLNGITLSDSTLSGAILYFLIQVVLAILFCAWLAGWYVARRKNQTSILRLIKAK